MDGDTFYHSKHIEYLGSLLLESKEISMSSFRMLSTKMGGMYWGLSAMLLLKLPIDSKSKSSMVAFMNSCFDEKSGGFGWSTGHDGHITSAHYALLIAEQIQYRFSSEVHESIISFVTDTCILPDGSVQCDKWGESDLRFSYDAACILTLIPGYTPDESLFPRLSAHIAKCRNFDGAYGPRPGTESHAAYTFCAVGALRVMGMEIADSDRLAHWLSERQTVSGGFNGRPEKAPDVCYSWWILSTLEMLGRSAWIDKAALREFILRSQDSEAGGIADRPECVADIFHTFFGFAALSLMGQEGLAEVDVKYAIVSR
jgi:geranylgeranyl transferase type-2 subunit beta